MTKTRFLPAFLFALLCCTATLASEVSSVQETTEYNSADDAAKAALTNIFNVTGESSNEWAGVIVQIKDKFFYTCPVSSGEFSTFTVRAAFPKSAKLVAIYHSHPGTEYAGEYFSPDDVAVAKQLNLPSYIGVLTSHNIHRYIPSKDSTQTYHNGSHIAKGFTSTGTVI